MLQYKLNILYFVTYMLYRMCISISITLPWALDCTPRTWVYKVTFVILYVLK